MVTAEDWKQSVVWVGSRLPSRLARRNEAASAYDRDARVGSAWAPTSTPSLDRRVIFQLTQKARDHLGLRSSDLDESAANDPPPLTNWYVNVLTLRRHKVVHITEATTFYTSMITDVRKGGLKYLGGLARDVIVESMTNDGFGFPALRDVIGQGLDRYTKTSSRQVLGVMNEQAAAFQAFVDAHGGLSEIRAPVANKKLNAMIVMPLKGVYTPRDAMAQALAKLPT